MNRMRIGLLGARGENRGLGNMTVEFARHVRPDRVLAVDLGTLSPYANDWTRYAFTHADGGPPGEMRVVPWDGGALPVDAVEWLADGCDIVYCAETPYDWGALERLRARGVTTVVHAMPELWRPALEPGLPQPDRVWLPTHWRHHLFPDAFVVPVPIASGGLPVPRVRERAVTFLHVAGHQAARDRNGTLGVLEAARLVKHPVRIVVRSQSAIPDDPYRPRGNVQLVVERGDLPDWQSLYREADVLIAPRRYGGLSLPMQEAFAQGMPVVTLDVEPQRAWMPKEARIEPLGSVRARMQGGEVDVWDFRPEVLAAKIDELYGSPATVEFLSRAALAYGKTLSWDRWADRYRSLLTEETRIVAGGE